MKPPAWWPDHHDKARLVAVAETAGLLLLLLALVLVVRSRIPAGASVVDVVKMAGGEK